MGQSPAFRSSVHYVQLPADTAPDELGRAAMHAWLERVRPLPEVLGRMVLLIDVSSPRVPVVHIHDAAKLDGATIAPAVRAATRGGGSWVVYTAGRVLDSGSVRADAIPLDTRTPRQRAMGLAGACN